jgi:serine/threonine protein kinase
MPTSGASSRDRPAADPALAELVDRLTASLQAGATIDVEEIAARHAEHADQLRRLLPALEVLADLGRSSMPGESFGPFPVAGAPAGMGLLGDFRIVREVGRGGMGVVYEAEQISLGRRVALKVLPFAAAMDPRQLQRFKVEAQSAAHLHHPHIVPVYSVGVERGVHYYAMQFIEGRSLAGVVGQLRREAGLVPDGDLDAGTIPTGGRTEDLATALTAPIGPAEVEARPAPRPSPSRPDRSAANGSPPWPSTSTGQNRPHFESVARLGIQAAEALEYAHSLGVVHRDIKPANLLLDPRGDLWVADFGLAQFHADAGLTMTGDVLGTLRYMSPEQALAKRGLVDHRADVYSLGVTLYELLTLRPAIEGVDRQEILRRVAFEEPPPPRRFVPRVPGELETIVLKAMAKEPEGRYATAQELADDLRRFLEHKPIKARRPTTSEQVVKWVRRQPSIAIGAVAMLLTTAFILGIAMAIVLREQAATREALGRARDERENARRHAARALTQSERAGHRLAVALQGLRALLLRLGDTTLPDVPQVAELRRSAREHSRRTIEQFLDATSPDPQALADSVTAYIHLANLSFLAGRLEECSEDFSRAIRLSERLMALDASDPSYASLLGRCHQIYGTQLFATGARDEAVAQLHRARGAFLRAVELDPSGFDGLRRLRWFLATCPEGRFRDPDRVLELTARMVEQEEGPGRPRPWDPSRSPHWLLTGLAHYRKGEFATAIAALDPPLRAMRLGRDSLYQAGDEAMGGFVLAMAHQQAGDRDRALDAYHAAARLMDTCRPRDAELMVFRAEASALLGVE